MKIIIMHQTIASHDAVGNDIELMYNILKVKYDCKAFAQNQFNPNLEYADQVELEEILNDQNSMIIYHHSVYWEYGGKILSQFKGKLIIRYHNITPAEYFAPYNDFHYSQCDMGRKQTVQFAEQLQHAFWLVDSYYNSLDIAGVDKNQIAICPPFTLIEKWAAGIPDEEVLKELLYDRKINLLFVGRVAPNKDHLFLLDVVHCYCKNYNTDIKLRIIGKFDDGIPLYNQIIKNRIKDYNIENNVEFIGEINDAILTSYYLGSDFFICTSEHEGFCVPIAEAQYFQLPIIARNTSAIADTLGNNQLIFDDDVKKYAAAIHILCNNLDYCKYLREKGTENYISRYTYDKISQLFQNILSERVGLDI